MGLDPEVWGPKYWFVIHSIAMSYPMNPNETSKKKYYRFIQDLPLFIPDAGIGKKFSELLDKYSVTPYLDSRDAFIRWTHFIHNKVNSMLGKRQISLLELYNEHYEHYKPKKVTADEDRKQREKIVYIATLGLAISLVVYSYKK